MRTFLLLMVLSVIAVGCRRSPKTESPSPPPAQIRVLNQYPPGRALGELLSDLNIGATAVRYRSNLPADRKSAIYFFDEGDLHVDSVKKNGTWILAAVPFLEPKTEPVVARLKKWDGGAETKSYEEHTGKSTR